MACNAATCESGCYRDASGEVGEEEHQKRPLTGKNGACKGDTRGAESSEPVGNRICVKCKLNETITASGSGGGGLRGDGEKFCADCFRSNLYGKFRFSVSSNAMISPSDNVLVAFSGGPSSRSLPLSFQLCICIALCMRAYMCMYA